MAVAHAEEDEMGRVRDTVTRGGEGALVGWRSKVADVVADPVARRTPLGRDWVRAILGWAFVALSLAYLYRFARRMT
jgi:hypothetical protein